MSPVSTPKEDLDRILNCFGGYENGMQFLRFMSMMKEIEKQAEQGSAKALELLEIQRKYAQLVKIGVEGLGEGGQ